MYGMTKGAKAELASGYSVTDRLIHQSSNLPVRGVVVVHVGGTRGVTSSIDQMIQIHARITWGVEVIRAIFFS